MKKQLLILAVALNASAQTTLFAQNTISPGKNIQSNNGLPQIAVTYSEAVDFYNPSGLKSTLPTHLCPTPKFDFSPSNAPASCTPGNIQLLVRDSFGTPTSIGDWMMPAVQIVIKTDFNNDVENRLEIWKGGSLIWRISQTNTGVGTPLMWYSWSGFFGTNMNNKTARMWLYRICSTDSIEYKWFDSANNGSFPWYVWDAVSKTVKASGTFIGSTSGSSTGKQTNFAGIGTWTCNTCPPGSLNKICNNGQGVFSPSQAPPGKYGITYTFNTGSGCINSYTDTLTVTSGPSPCTLVWPGDANRDLVADNNDLLAIGIGYGKTGPARSDQRIIWAGFDANDWTNSFSNSTNYKSADCNGDGTIDAKDTTAIILNYGLTHNLKEAQPVYTSGIPDLTINIPIDTVLFGNTIKVPILLGSGTNQGNDIYGAAFSIIYDPSVVDTSKLSASITGSWLGTNGTDLLSIAKNFGTLGRLDIGLTRIDNTNKSGYGKIGELNLPIRVDLPGNNPIKLFIKTTKIRSINNAETNIALNSGIDSVIVIPKGSPLAINKYSNSSKVSVYPNPTSGLITIELNASDIKSIRLVNILGETESLINNNIGNKFTIDTQLLPVGTYYLSIISSQERVVKQVNIIKD